MPIAIAATTSSPVEPPVAAKAPSAHENIAAWLRRTAPIDATPRPLHSPESIAIRYARPTNRPTRSGAKPSRGATAGASTDGALSTRLASICTPSVTNSASSGRVRRAEGETEGNGGIVGRRGSSESSEAHTLWGI